MTATGTQPTRCSQIAARAADAKGGEDLVALDVSEPLPLVDIFLLVTGRNERNVAAIADEIEDKLLEAGHKRLRREGRQESRWVLLDFGDLVVHVFHEQERVFYGLERLWKDCPVVPIDVRRPPPPPSNGGQNRCPVRRYRARDAIQPCRFSSSRRRYRLDALVRSACDVVIWSGCPGVFGAMFGPVAQLVAHLHGMQGVRGSSPLRSTESLLLRSLRRGPRRAGCGIQCEPRVWKD